MELKDYRTGFKSGQAIQRDAKQRGLEILYEALSKVADEENLSWVRVGTDTQTNAIALVVGTATAKDGSEQEVCVVYDAVAKNYEEKKGPVKTFPAFDRFEAEEEYKRFMRIKAEKTDEKEKKSNE